ncbi:MAM and LDL-receptor class A domain-containing protein 2-like isoform X3 [Montipora foliosa]|uniref:MAM and LDL-receptor class A domain-containing protein 2-like isoform X3 n=1 Tax=Montipora foliosa TaxID=591990 RepID=UPI0035F11CB9
MPSTVHPILRLPYFARRCFLVLPARVSPTINSNFLRSCFESLKNTTLPPFCLFEALNWFWSIQYLFNGIVILKASSSNPQSTSSSSYSGGSSGRSASENVFRLPKHPSAIVHRRIFRKVRFRKMFFAFQNILQRLFIVIISIQRTVADYSCNFENGLCAEWSQSSTDDFNWTLHSGSTASSSTGPSLGHGGYGYFMFIETSFPRREGDNATLELVLPGNGKLGCLSFYYHMYGADMGTLNVFSGNMKVFNESGNKGNIWRKAERTIVLGHKITFEGIRGASFTGDLAIDDVSLTDGICSECKKALNDSFGHLNITYNDRFDPICTWTIGKFGFAEQVAIVSIEGIHLVYCSEYVKVFDGSGAQVFTWEGCRKNHTLETFLEVPFQESHNVTIQVLLENRQSYLKVDYGTLKDGLFSATYIAGWKIIFENRTSKSLQFRWMDINNRLNADVRFYVVIAESSHNSVPVRKLFSPNITSIQITDLAPYTEYNVSVVAIDADGSPFVSEFLLAMTDEGVPTSAPSTLFITNISSTHVTIQWSPLPRQYHNGRLLGYKVFFQKASNTSFPVDESSVTVSNSTWVTLRTLDPGQRYKVYVSAFTSKGDGPRSSEHFVTTACRLSVNLSVGLIDVAPASDYDPLDCSWTIGKVGITNAVALFIVQRINISSCSEHLKIFDGNKSLEYQQTGDTFIDDEQMVEVPFLSSDEITVNISLTRLGSSVKAQYVILRSGLLSAPNFPGWNCTIVNKTPSSISVQWTDLTVLLNRQVRHFLVFLKLNEHNGSYSAHQFVNGSELGTEITGLIASSIYTVVVFGIDKMGKPYKTTDVQTRTMNATCGMRPTSSTLIVGGTVAPSNDWPWQAMLRSTSGRQFCGGSLIRPEWVLTAAHCIERRSPSNIEVTLGAHYISRDTVVGTEQYFDVVQIIQHENYSYPSFPNDVALLRLSKPAKLRNGVGLVCLSDDKFQLPFDDEDKKCWITGWGTLYYYGPKPKELMQVEIPLVSRENCSYSYPGLVDDSMICVGRSQGGIGACHGDSGGPLVCEFNGKWYLEGVTSWGGLPCGTAGKPTVYANVRYLKSWIMNNMNNAPLPELVTNCGSVVNSTLRSPGYPSSYPSNTDCVYRVPIPCDKELVIYFNYFHLEYASSCWYDYLRITDGSNRIIGKYCGRQTGRSVLVNDTVAVLFFHTDGSDQYNGFHLSFSFFPLGNATLLPYTVPSCGSFQNDTLRSPGYPSNYQRNLDCVNRVPIPFYQELVIYFNFFHLEYHTNCGYDYLRITDGSNRIIGKYCGQQTGRSVLVNDTVAVLFFHTDGSVQYNGFHLSFSFLPLGNATLLPYTPLRSSTTQRPSTTPAPNCGFVQNDTLRSPGYPNYYPNNMDCVYRVSIPHGKDLIIYFNDFNLESHSNCAYDYLRITNDSNDIIGVFCGLQIGNWVRVTGNFAEITFHSDRITQRTGYELFFSYSGYPVSCNFDSGLCYRWNQSQLSDVFNWTRGTGGTPSLNTGPSSDHTTGSGYYMFIETSSPRQEGDNAKLELVLPGNGELGCLFFYYHMYGTDMGTLNVFSGNMKVFNESGNQGNIWRKAETTIVLGHKLAFEGIRGSSFRGDLAIDDVLITNGSCLIPRGNATLRPYTTQRPTTTPRPRNATLRPYTTQRPTTTPRPRNATLRPYTTQPPTTTPRPRNATLRPYTTQRPTTTPRPRNATLRPYTTQRPTTTPRPRNATLRPYTTQRPTTTPRPCIFSSTRVAPNTTLSRIPIAFGPSTLNSASIQTNLPRTPSAPSIFSSTRVAPNTTPSPTPIALEPSTLNSASIQTNLPQTPSAPSIFSSTRVAPNTTPSQNLIILGPSTLNSASIQTTTPRTPPAPDGSFQYGGFDLFFS